MGMTTSEMRAAFEKWVLQARKQTQPFGLVERSGKGYLDLYTQKHWEGWQAALATPSVASPRAAWKDDALQSRINEAVDEANGVTAAPVGEPGRTPPTGLVNELEREIIRLNEELRLERFQFRLWRGAWLRHLGGYIVRKAHEIDGFGLRHEQQLKEEYERGVGDAKNAMACRDKWIEEVGKALAAPPAQGAPTPRSQVQIFGGPAPKTWDDYEEGCLKTYGGGYHEEREIEIFHHGISTVFNLLRAEFPLAAQGAPGTREAQTFDEWWKTVPGYHATGVYADLYKDFARAAWNAALAQPGAPTKEGTCKEKLFS